MPITGSASARHVGDDFVDLTRGCLPRSIAEKGLSLGGSDGGVSGSRFFCPKSAAPKRRGQALAIQGPGVLATGTDRPGSLWHCPQPPGGVSGPCPQACHGRLPQTVCAFQAAGLGQAGS